MSLKDMMTPATLKTIINTAPLIFQATDKLLRLIREWKGDTIQTTDNEPDTLEGLKQRIKQIEGGLEENFRSDVEQIRLIEQLAKQNESLAETLKQTYRKITILTWLSVIAVGASGLAILLLIVR